MYRNGRVVTLLLGKKYYHFFFLFQTVYVHAFSLIFSCASFYIYLHLMSYCILSPIAQSFTILSLTELDRIQPCGSQLGFDEQTAKSSKHLRCSSMNHPRYRLARDLQPVLGFSLSTKLKDCQCHQDCHPHVSSQTLGFSNHIQDFRKCSCSTTTGETGSNGSLMT